MKKTVMLLIVIISLVLIVSLNTDAQLTCGEELTCNMPGYGLSIRNNGGHGIVGYSRAYNGKGVLGRSDKDRGIGVFGLNPRASGTTYGVYGSANSPDGVGVYGINTGGGYAGYFEGAAGVTDDLMVDGDVFLGKADESTRYIKMPRTSAGNNGNLELQAGGVTGSSGTAFQGGNIVLRAGDLNSAGGAWVGSGAVKIYAGKNHFTNYYHGDIIFYAGNNYEERMRIIGNDGKVGIGTQNPGYQLAVQSSGNDNYLSLSEDEQGGADGFEFQIAPGNGTATTRIGYLRGNFGNSSGFYIYNERNAPLRFGTNGYGNERMRITGSGNVGIGTQNPAGTLDVNGPIYQRGFALHADFVFEPDYKLESIDEHSEFMWKNRHLKAIPKAEVDENGLEIVEVGSHRKGIVEELEKAHIYIEQLHSRIKELEARLIKLETEK